MSAFDPKRTSAILPWRSNLIPFDPKLASSFDLTEGGCVRRRDFIKAIAGLATVWPLTAPAQQSEQQRRIGVLIPYLDDREFFVLESLTAFKQRLHELGWIDGRNIRIDYRFTGQNADRIHTASEELIALAPDLIVVWANPAVAILRKATQTIPIVFVVVSDPVGSGFVTNLAQPGGNITGFQNFETAIGGKWLEILKDIAPGVRRVAFVHNPEITAHLAFMHAAQAASTSWGMTVTPAGVSSALEIERTISAFAQEPNGGLIVAPSPFTTTNQDLVIQLASKLRLPAVYPFRYFATGGGLASYGFETAEQHRGAASYVDRILKGEKPGNLPVQAPARYALVINLKTAKMLSLEISRDMQLRADELIE
jgi:putative tryptophan/tyrosine transport system substrate-binding protein